MRRFGRVMVQAFWQVAVGAGVAGVLDLVWTLDSEEPEEWGFGLGIAVAILGFTGTLFLLVGTSASIIPALLAPDTVASPRTMVARLRALVWPPDPGARLRAGVRWILSLLGCAVFTVCTNVAALVLIESIRTTYYAATACTLVALATGIGVIALHRAVLSRFFRALESVNVAPLAWISPPLAILLSAVGIGGVLWWRSDNIHDIVAATNLKPFLVIGGGLLAALVVGIGQPMAWRASIRRIVLGVLAAVPILAFLATAIWIGEDNETRAIVANRSQVTPLAYRLLKSVADLDGDGQLAFMGEGDCDDFDASVHAGAPEIPNNGIDEDCEDGDLDLNLAGAERKPRWDYPVPAQIRRNYHVVLLSIDAVSPSHMSLFGYSRPTTPFLEELAKESVLFPVAYSQGPSTRLAFPAMWTSRYDTQIAYAVGPKIPLEILPSNLTLAEVMKTAGYRTVAVMPTRYFRDWKGFAQGFDVVNTDAVAFDKAPDWHNAAEVTDAALASLKSEAPRGPIFLWMHYYDPHAPCTKPPTGPLFGDKEADIYDSELAYTDAEIRRFVTGLWQILKPEDTILIVTGDHGEAFDEAHPNRHHGYDLHSEVLRLPLLIRTPFSRPSQVDMPVTPMDLLPTLVNLMRIPGSFAFEGNSLLPQLLGEPGDEKRIVFHQFYLSENVYHKRRTLQHVGIRTASLYLIHDLTNNTLQLYRYRIDSMEVSNRIGDMPEATAILKAELSRWMARVAR